MRRSARRKEGRKLKKTPLRETLQTLCASSQSPQNKTESQRPVHKERAGGGNSSIGQTSTDCTPAFRRLNSQKHHSSSGKKNHAEIGFATTSQGLFGLSWPMHTRPNIICCPKPTFTKYIFCLGSKRRETLRSKGEGNTRGITDGGKPLIMPWHRSEQGVSESEREREGGESQRQ